MNNHLGLFHCVWIFGTFWYFFFTYVLCAYCCTSKSIFNLLCTLFELWFALFELHIWLCKCCSSHLVLSILCCTIFAAHVLCHIFSVVSFLLHMLRVMFLLHILWYIWWEVYCCFLLQVHKALGWNRASISGFNKAKKALCWNALSWKQSDGWIWLLFLDATF